MVESSHMARVLFVDDDPVTLTMLCKIAEIEGHEPLRANSGRTALEKAAEGTPDLIVLDMNMPDMDGLSVIRKLRADIDTQRIPVVVLTAGFELDAADMVLEAGGQAYRNKPIGMDELRDIILEYATSG